ncbi:methylthioadenosine nucleosidase /adenosylhomocysteine nucleosidase [Melghirimyces profundicolus]|uniref:adenosylhomocysteine nucleosidase n=1 Tax=Melghirimyces profundicolus TaxID=1242148 RepID=A0A2T6BGL8_9BACL|nr:5'-methylthioadenosine/adenosylhomocysteine nucleosidase [Melghirimyces profundicolus]PTX55196.1 methylthioadenosine nucleosidase /adenosylhomocysteine nucleosidase [Melghirimyces profundicolus]
MGKTIGLIGAMAEEVALFLEEMEENAREEYAGIVFHRGSFSGAPVVVCRSGVGKVNASVCTQLLIDRFDVGTVIFTGVAGALDPALDIGDIVVSKTCVQYDVDASPLGFPKGTIPFQETSVFQADPEWIRLAMEAAEAWTEGKAIRGKVLSGDRFIAHPEQVRELRETFGGACVEMEGAAVAHVCHLNRIPFVVIRSMSDRADFSAGVNFTEFASRAARCSNGIVKAMLKKHQVFDSTD